MRSRYSSHTTQLSSSQVLVTVLLRSLTLGPLRLPHRSLSNLKCYHCFWWLASSTERQHSISLARFSNSGVWSVNLCSLIGAAPKDYKKNEPVVLDVNALRPGLRYDDAKLVSTVVKILYNATLIFHWLQQSLINCGSLSH